MSSEEIDASFKKIGEGVKSATAKVGKALAAAGTALMGVAAATTDYRQQQAQLNAAFEQAGLSAASAKGAYSELYKVIGEDDQAVESAANIAMLANSEKEAAQWAELAAGVLGTFHDTLQPEAFYEAANETLKLGEATGAFTQMLEQTGVMSVDEFNKKLAECRTEQEKQALMLSVSKSAMGAAGEAYNKATADIQRQREEQAKLNETLATVGAVMTPILTMFISFANDALAVVVPYLQQMAQEYGPTLKTVLEEIAIALQTAFEWASKHKELLAAIAIVIGTVVAAIGLYNAVAAVKAAMAAMEVASVMALVAAYAAQAAAMLVAIAPYALIVAAIAGFIAIVVKAYKENETFRNIVDKVFNDIKSIISSVMGIVKSVISTAWTVIKTIWDSGLKQILNFVLTILAKVVEVFTNKLNAVLTFVSTLFKAVSNVIKSNLNTAQTIVKNVISLIKGIFTGDLGAAKQAVVNILNAILSNFKTKMNSAKSVVKGAINAIKGFFNFKWSLPPLKLPSIDITGKFSLNPPSAPKFSINWNALGGVFDKPTLFGYGGSLQGLGEDGAEAVVPLEKNTQWLDRLADRLAAKQNGIPIVLQVDGKTFAQVSIDSINALTKQRGSLGLNLVQEVENVLF